MKSKIKNAFEKTDVGNAERFSEKFMNRLMFVPEQGKWYQFCSHCWEVDMSRQVVLAAVSITKDMFTEAKDLRVQAAKETDNSQSSVMTKIAESLDRHARATQQKGRIEAMIRLAEPMLAKSASYLDSDDMLLGVKNGVIDLRKGEFRPGKQEDLITLRAGVNWVSANAPCPRWLNFLESVQPDPEVRLWIQKLAGYLLTGRDDEQIFLIFLGNGANGKSVFVEVLKEVIGQYAKTTQFASFSIGNKSTIRNDLAGLVKARMVAASEGGVDTQLDEGIVKQLTGGDTVSTRFLFQEFFSFRPNFKVILVTNHEPRIVGTDHGIWRRIRMLPWNVTIPEAQQDPGLKTKLLQEASGILAWAVQGTQMWLRDGLKNRPITIKDAVEFYKEDQDVIAQWLTECCRYQPNAFAASKTIYQSYTKWAKSNGHIILSQKSLANQLHAKGLTIDKKGDRGWRGILVGDTGNEG